ncbi:SPOSA6832_04572, partial [Sporobolomyces salmonicolor]
MMRSILVVDAPRLLSKSGRRPSEAPLLPSVSDTCASSNRRTRGRWLKVLGAVVVGCWLLSLGRSTPAVEAMRRSTFASLQTARCEARGLFSPAGKNDRHRVAVRLRPPQDADEADRNPDNTVLPQSFHPVLTSQQPALFAKSSTPLPALPADAKKACIVPSTHSLPLIPRPRPYPVEPTIFFSMCTAPQRAVTYAPIWKHFMVPDVSYLPSSKSPTDATTGRRMQIKAPGCLVTDAQGNGDSKGMARANVEFRRQGLSCVMKESSRVGERYEMRVLGLIRDAWVESERRRWQEGAPLVEWFIFGDDDTWWSDQAMLREMLAGYDSREDHLFGTFSESRGTIEAFGKIAFGGGGMVISRGLVRKMQSMIDKCADRFKDVFGGDGIVVSSAVPRHVASPDGPCLGRQSNCAAWTRGIPLEMLVEEVPAMRQSSSVPSWLVSQGDSPITFSVDLRGDATGYLNSGQAPFMTLQYVVVSFPLPALAGSPASVHSHWASWLDLIPNREGIDVIKLLSSAASIVGGPNFLRRWVFDGGLVTVALGYSVTVHREALTEEDLGRTEWTWSEHEPRRPARPGLKEGSDKLTYYLSAVERLSPDLALFRHTCSDPSVKSGLHQIDILWDTRTTAPTWADRMLARWNDDASPSPSAGEQPDRDPREREDDTWREKAKRKVEFAG